MIIDTASSLTRRARDIYSDRRMAAKWVLAARNLRARHAWILEGAAPKWGYKPIPCAAAFAACSEATRTPAAILNPLSPFGIS